MSLVPGAVSLARALCALERVRATGVLTVSGSYDSCRIALVQGVPRAACSKRSDATLGDVLLRGGDLDRAAHARALESWAQDEPVGSWLVRTGVATRPAVEHALRAQLRARILEAFRFHGLDYRFAAGSAQLGVPFVAEPVATPDLVLGALRRVIDRAEAHRQALQLGTATLTLSPLGRALLRDAALWPDEAAMLPLLERGADLRTLRSASAGSERALATLCALVLIAAVVPSAAPSARYRLLLRKHRQLGSRASAAELLDLPGTAHPGDARRALRRLARTVHPDVLGADVPALVRARSAELMSALGNAERELRAAYSKSRAR